MANLQNVLRGLRILGSYSDYVQGYSRDTTFEPLGYIVAGPRCESYANQFLHQNEKSILESNDWFWDESTGHWTIDTGFVEWEE